MVGWSSSGAAAAKFYQDTNYTSAALYVIRQATSLTSPTVVISATSGLDIAHALQILQPGTTNVVFYVSHGGAVSSLYQRFGSGVPIMAA